MTRSAGVTATAEALPTVPSAPYLLELGAVHLGYDHRLRGSSDTLKMLTEGLPGELRSPYMPWYKGGQLGEVGKTAVLLEQEETPSLTAQVQAVHRSAAALSVIGVADAVAGEYRSDRTVYNTDGFLGNMARALMGEDLRPLFGGPRRQNTAYDYAYRIGNWLNLSNNQRFGLGCAFNNWATAWLEQLAESGRGNPRPQRLLDTARDLGARSAKMAAWATVGRNGHPALASLGQIGGVELHGTRLFGAVKRRIHTYATALVQDYGTTEGLSRAQAMRQEASKASYNQALESVSSDRHRRVVRTVTWFAVQAGKLDRRKEGVEGKHAQTLAAPLEISVRAVDWQAK